MQAGPPDPDELLSYRPLVRRLARRASRRGQDAEEIEQCVWVRVLEHPPRHASGLASWLRLVVRSVSANLRERDALRRAREHDHGGEGPRDSGPSMDADERERLVLALKRLDAAKAEVLRMRFFEDRSAADIARELGVPLETVRTRLKRGIAEVRAHLAPEA